MKGVCLPSSGNRHKPAEPDPGGRINLKVIMGKNPPWDVLERAVGVAAAG